MLLEEALLIGRILDRIPAPDNVIDIGSSTHEYRTKIQPHIDRYIFKPLREKGAKITYLDVRHGDGIDIVADISSRSFRLHHEYDLVICANMLYLCRDIKTSVSNMSSLVREDGYLIVSVPSVFPYHDAPFDTLRRFKPDDLHDLFRHYSFQKIYAGVVSKKLTFKEWGSMCIRSFIQIFRWKKFQMIVFNLKQCSLKQVKASIVVFKKVSSKA